LDFLHPIIAGVNHELIKAVTTTPNNVAQYSGGRGGGGGGGSEICSKVAKFMCSI
jgi:hypothetical protein